MPTAATGTGSFRVTDGSREGQDWLLGERYPCSAGPSLSATGGAAADEQHGHDEYPQPEQPVGQQPDFAGPHGAAQGDPHAADDSRPLPAGKEACRSDHPTATAGEAAWPRATQVLAKDWFPWSKAYRAI